MIHPLPAFFRRRPASVFLALLLMGLFFATLPGISRAAGSPPETFADLADKLSPTVVNIYTTQTVKPSRSPHDLFNHQDIPEPFRRFFGLPSPFDQDQPQREQKRTSLGSGVIISKDGYQLRGIRRKDHRPRPENRPCPAQDHAQKRAAGNSLRRFG